MAKVFIFSGLIITRIQKKVQNEHPNKTVSKPFFFKIQIPAAEKASRCGLRARGIVQEV